jgi:hypothetical protein
MYQEPQTLSFPLSHLKNQPMESLLLLARSDDPNAPNLSKNARLQIAGGPNLPPYTVADKYNHFEYWMGELRKTIKRASKNKENPYNYMLHFAFVPVTVCDPNEPCLFQFDELKYTNRFDLRSKHSFKYTTDPTSVATEYQNVYEQILKVYGEKSPETQTLMRIFSSVQEKYIKTYNNFIDNENLQIMTQNIKRYKGAFKFDFGDIDLFNETIDAINEYSGKQEWIICVSSDKRFFTIAMSTL